MENDENYRVCVCMCVCVCVCGGGGGGGVLISTPWNEISRGGGGSKAKVPSVRGGGEYGYFLELHNDNSSGPGGIRPMFG